MAGEDKLGIATIPIRATLNELDKDLSAAKGRAQKGVDEINGVFGKIGLGTIAAGAAAAGISKFLGDAVKMAQEAEIIQADLDAVIKSTGGAAGMTADEINDMATQLSGVTRFEDDVIVKADAMLLTFTKIGKEVLPDATLAVLNMAEKFGSVEAATMQIGKALNDPVTGVGALRRVGVALSEEQEAAVKKLVEGGDIAGAQLIILKELETEFGGAAVAAAQTSAGQMDILNNKLGNTQGAIGAGLLPVIGELTTKFSELLTPLTGSNEQLTGIVGAVAMFEATPLIAALENATTVMKGVNEVTGFFDGLLKSVMEKLGITAESTEDMGESFTAVMLPITLLTQGPMAALRDLLKVIADLWDQMKGFNVGQLTTDLHNIGIPGFATGGVVPGPVGMPQLAVVHGGETVIPAGSMTFGGASEHTIRFENVPAGIDQSGMERAVYAAMESVFSEARGRVRR